MPTYSYRCTSCENEFDIRQSFSDEPLKVCEKCGGNLRKLFNSVGIVFKGSGFYHNDAKAGSGALQAKSTSTTEGSGTATSSDASSNAASAELSSNGGASSDASNKVSSEKPSSTPVS